MTISGIENVGLNPSDQGATVGKAGGEMGKDQFLQLLVTEMKNQDPLNPVDNKEMVAQLAQFSALEQMQNVSKQVEGLRQENGLVSAVGITNKQISAKLSDGSYAFGLVNSVLWEDGGIKLQIGDQQYAASDIVSLTLVN
jgi:flagellar basal-body rod modification protein FlgD